MSKHVIENAIWGELFESSISKGQRRKIQMVEAAIQIISKNGSDQMTFDRLAEACEVTRQLVMHYFPDRADLIKWGAKYVRAHMQKHAIAMLKTEKTVKGQLTAYVRSTFLWVKKFPQYAAFWSYYHYQCVVRKDFNKINSELVEIGHQRIEALIQAGIEKNEFKCLNPRSTAKIIQNMITGSLVSYGTENYAEISAKLETWTITHILLLLDTPGAS